MCAMFNAVIFDMDGTLTRPVLDFGVIRNELGLPPGDLAAQILAMDPADQRRAWAVIEVHERRAMQEQELQEGAGELLQRCYDDHIRLGLLTRNAQKSVDHLCERYDLHFDITITREFSHIKPHPAPIVHMLEAWQVDPPRALMVGDYVHDVECGIAAGTRTCFFQNPGKPWYGEKADYTVSSMAELGRILFG